MEKIVSNPGELNSQTDSYANSDYFHPGKGFCLEIMFFILAYTVEASFL